jgi:hypothetical protein
MPIEPLSFLPELVSGRGTARQSRVVEGQPGCRFGNDATDDPVGVPQYLHCRNTKRRNPGPKKPRIARFVAQGAVAASMGFAVDFDSQPRVAAEKVENERPGRMLAAKFEAGWALSERLPNLHLWHAHFSAKASRAANGDRAGLWCDVFEHASGPSTMLRMVPLPEKSSGRIVL